MSLHSIALETKFIVMDYLPFRDALSLHSTCRVFRSAFFAYFHFPFSEVTSLLHLRNRFHAFDPSILAGHRMISSAETTNFNDLCLHDVKFLLRSFIPRVGLDITTCTALREVMQTLNNEQLISMANRAVQHDDEDLFLQIAQSDQLETEAATDETEEKSDHCALLHAIVGNLDIDILERFVTLPAFARIPVSDKTMNRDGNLVDVEEHLANCFVRVSMECEDVDLGLEFSAILFDNPRFNEMDNVQKGIILMNYVGDRKWAFVERFLPYFMRTMTMQDINNSFATHFSIEEYDETRLALFRQLILVIARQNRPFLNQ